MVDRNDSVEGMLAYLQRSRALSAQAREKLRILIQLARDSNYIDSDKVGLSTIDDNTVYIYLYTTEGNYFQLLFDTVAGLKLHHAPSESRMSATNFLIDWERITVNESSDALVGHITQGLNKVIAFQNGKAYEMTMREVGEFDSEFYVRQHVTERLGNMQTAYQQTLESLRGNLDTQRARYEDQLSRLRQQNLGDIDIDWARVARGHFFPYRLPRTHVMGLAAITPVAIKRVKWNGGDTQVTLRKPYKLPDAMVFKEISGRWHVLTRDGAVYPHPHVKSGGAGQTDYAIMCVGDAGDCENRLTHSNSFELQIKRIREVLAGINWASPYRTSFPESIVDNERYIEGYEIFDVYAKVHDLDAMDRVPGLAYTTQNIQSSTIEL